MNRRTRVATAGLVLAVATLAIPAVAGPRPVPPPLCGIDPLPPCPTAAPAPDVPPLGPQPEVPARGCTPTAPRPDVWEEYAPPVVTAYSDWYHNTYQAVRKDLPFAVVVDPFLPCRLYRVGTPEAGFRDRHVVQRSEDTGRTWTTVLKGSDTRFKAMRLHVPRENAVYVTEDGNGSALVASTDAGRTWDFAHGDRLPGKHLYDLVFARDRRTMYAVTQPCREPGSPRTGGCEESFVQEHMNFVGLAELWSSADGGRTWTGIDLPEPGRGRLELVVRTDPTSDCGLFVYDAIDRPEPTATPTTAVRVRERCGEPLREASVLGYVVERGSVLATGREGGVRLFAGQQRYSDDRGETWNDPSVGHPFTARSALASHPEDELFGFVAYRFGGDHGVEGRAVRLDYDARPVEQFVSPEAWDGLPLAGASNPFFLEDVQYDLSNPEPTYYVTVAVYCDYPLTAEGAIHRCGKGRPEHSHRWHLLRYQPKRWAPVATSAGSFPDPPAPCVDCVVTERAACRAEGARGAGLAYTGRSLLYPSARRAGTPFTVEIHRVEAGTCEDRGVLRVRLDEDDYRAARERTRRNRVPDGGSGEAPPMDETLDERYPLAGALAYDAERDVLYFGLRDRDVDAARGTPASVWVVPLAGTGGDRRVAGVARLAFSDGRCLDAPEAGEGGMELLAFDQPRDLLYACRDARLAASGPAGRCYQHPAFRGEGTGWRATSVAPVDRGLLVLVEVTQQRSYLVDYDPESCTARRGFTANALVAARTEGTRIRNYVGSQLVCDPVTFAGETVLWTRWHDTLRAWRVPGGDRWCSVGTTTTVERPRDDTFCGRLTVDGEPVDLPVTLTLDGRRVPAARASAGLWCAGVTPRPGRHLAEAAFAGSGGYLPSSGRAAFSVPVAAAPAPAPAPARPPAAREDLPSRRPPPPVAPQSRPQPVTAGAPAPPAQPVANVGGIQGEKQEESQLALVEEGTVRDQEEEVAGELAMTGLGAALVTTAAAVFARCSRGSRDLVTQRRSP